jgi:hypothetical protein
MDAWRGTFVRMRTTLHIVAHHRMSYWFAMLDRSNRGARGLFAIVIASFLAALFDLGAAEAAGPDAIVPHRAGYEFRLESVRPGSGVVDANGVLSYAWGDSCDGWTVEQRYVLDITRGQGSSLRVSASYANWESKDGLRYRFYVKRTRRSREGSETSEVQGKAKLDGPNESGKARFEKPRKEVLDLPAGTLFPTAHTFVLLKKAKAGVKFERRLVFDGSEVEGPSTMTAFLLPKRTAPPGGHPKSLIVPQPVWPMNIAVFSEKGKVQEPEFEMTIYLQANGVVPEMTMDYGDFVVRATLKLFEVMKKPDC